jgi:hypothetical protein
MLTLSKIYAVKARRPLVISAVVNLQIYEYRPEPANIQKLLTKPKNRGLHINFFLSELCLKIVGKSFTPLAYNLYFVCLSVKPHPGPDP